MNLFLQIRRMVFVFAFASATVQAAQELRLATFDIDVTPPVGALMAYDPVKRVDELGLRARGVVLLGADDPIVLCAVFELACLSIGSVRVLHMPGELFVEYQLAAKAMRPDLRVMMAAYGDYGPGYIGTSVAYGEGGYETSTRASNVAPSVEPVLMDGMKKLLEVK